MFLDWHAFVVLPVLWWCRWEKKGEENILVWLRYNNSDGKGNIMIPARMIQPITIKRSQWFIKNTEKTKYIATITMDRKKS